MIVKLIMVPAPSRTLIPLSKVIIYCKRRTILVYLRGNFTLNFIKWLNWKAIAQGSQVLVIYMGMKHVERISTELIAAGRPKDEPCAVVTSATTDAQQVLETTLGTMTADIAASGMQPPAILCVGRSVLMRQVLDWQGMLLGETPRDLDPLGRGRPAESA